MTNVLAYCAVVLITAEKEFYDFGLRKAFILSSWMDVWLTLLKVKLLQSMIFYNMDIIVKPFLVALNKLECLSLTTFATLPNNVC
jgi:hypothetical protein